MRLGAFDEMNRFDAGTLEEVDNTADAGRGKDHHEEVR
jgi:hypothetical protein